MQPQEYDALDAAGVEAAVAAGTLSTDEAVAHEQRRAEPRADVLKALGAEQQPVPQQAKAEPVTANSGPQESNTVPGPSSPAQLAVQHGTQDEPRDYQAAEQDGPVGPSGTEDEPRGYLPATDDESSSAGD